jgi:hypothetical protein
MGDNTYEGAIKYSFDVKGLLVESKHNISPRRFANPRRIGKYERGGCWPFLSSLEDQYFLIHRAFFCERNRRLIDTKNTKITIQKGSVMGQKAPTHAFPFVVHGE